MNRHYLFTCRYIVVVVLRNSGFAIDHCHGQGEKHEERRDGTRGIASRTEHHHETFHTAGSLIIVCPSYLTTYTGNIRTNTLPHEWTSFWVHICAGIYIHTKANWTRVIVYLARKNGEQWTRCGCRRVMMVILLL